MEWCGKRRGIIVLKVIVRFSKKHTSLLLFYNFFFFGRGLDVVSMSENLNCGLHGVDYQIVCKLLCSLNSHPHRKMRFKASVVIIYTTYLNLIHNT